MPDISDIILIVMPQNKNNHDNYNNAYSNAADIRDNNARYYYKHYYNCHDCSCLSDNNTWVIIILKVMPQIIVIIMPDISDNNTNSNATDNCDNHARY